MTLLAATRSEYTKQFSTAGWWVLGIVLVVYVAFTAGALAFVFGGVASGRLTGANGPAVSTDGVPALVYSSATAVGYVFPLLIGTLMVTTEFRHKTLTPTLLATPRRGVVLVGKFAVGILVGAPNPKNIFSAGWDLKAVARGEGRDDTQGFDLGPGGSPFTATASVRTLYGADAFLKFSLNVRITNCLRKNAAYELTGAVALTRLLAGPFADLARRFPDAAVLYLKREPGA